MSKKSLLQDKDTDFDEESDWEIVTEWARELDNFFLVTGKRKTAGQIGEEIFEKLSKENKKSEVELETQQIETSPEPTKLKTEPEIAEPEEPLLPRKDEVNQPEDEQDILFHVNNNLFHWMTLKCIASDYIPYRSLKDPTPECWYTKEEDLEFISETKREKIMKLRTKGNEEFAKGKYSEALESYSKAISLLPASPDERTQMWIWQQQPEDIGIHSLFLNRATAYSKLKQFRLAIADCERSLELKPDFSKSYYRKAQSYFQLKYYSKAVNTFKQALYYDQENKEILRELCIASAYKSVAKASIGRVYTWGKGPNGELGRAKDTESVIAQKVDLLESKNIFCISTNYHHNVAVSKDRTLYTWGKGDRLQLGNERAADEVEPYLVESLTGIQITFAACGLDHTIACSGTKKNYLYLFEAEGNLFTWGGGKSGQLGHGSTADEKKPKQVASLKGVFVSQVAAGKNHSVALTATGVVYAWGDNYHSQCGNGKDGNEVYSPQKVRGLEDVEIVQICCGTDHSLALDREEGYVYSWGRGSYGQLGLGEVFSSSTARMIVHLRDQLRMLGDKDYPIFVRAGGHHNAAVTKMGRAYMWGKCDEGALGMGELRPRVSINKPVLVKFGKHLIKHAGCGKRHSVVLTEEGKGFSMGKGDLFNFAAGGSYLEPQAMEGMEDEFAFEVHCGFSHSCVLVSFDSSKKEAFNPRWEIDPPPQELLTTPSILRQPEEAPKTRKPRITDFNAWNKWKPSEVDSDEEREKEIERLKKKSELKFEDVQVRNKKGKMVPVLGFPSTEDSSDEDEDE